MWAHANSSIHFKLVGAYLFFTISIILTCSFGFVLCSWYCFWFFNLCLSQQNIYCNHAYYLISVAFSSNNFPLLSTVPLSVMRGRAYFKRSKEHSGICVKTAKVYLFEHI